MSTTADRGEINYCDIFIDRKRPVCPGVADTVTVEYCDLSLSVNRNEQIVAKLALHKHQFGQAQWSQYPTVTESLSKSHER